MPATQASDVRHAIERSTNLQKTMANGIVRDVLLTERTPHGIALAISIGIMIGILPKANLVVALFVLLLFVMRCNLIGGLISILVATLCAPNFDGFLHAIGKSVLTFPWFQGIYRMLFSLPLIPWTGLDNTVVVGGTIIGILQFFPTYLLVRRLGENQLVSWQMTHEDPVPE
jgi:uncharacterized protein (TIGR03546 family)